MFGHISFTKTTQGIKLKGLSKIPGKGIAVIVTCSVLILESLNWPFLTGWYSRMELSWRHDGSVAVSIPKQWGRCWLSFQEQDWGIRQGGRIKSQDPVVSLASLQNENGRGGWKTVNTGKQTSCYERQVLHLSQAVRKVPLISKQPCLG